MTTVGIDQISFATSDKYVDMKELAAARNVDPNKYLIGIGQSQMAAFASDQDIVTLAATAALPIVEQNDLADLELLIVASESGIDNSKAAAMYVLDLLDLPKTCRAFEIKQACYGATAGLQMAKDFVSLHPDKKALVIGADIARYGLNTPGEPTQGGGAVAMLITAAPRILGLNDDASYYAANIMDFWRPLNHSTAMVDGKYSAGVYLDFFEQVFKASCAKGHLQLTDFAALLFHLPYTKMGKKALLHAFKLSAVDELTQTHFLHQFEASITYSRQVGNLYTGSLYLGLLSLLQNSSQLKAGQRLGMFSYGSGAQGEFFSGTLQSGWQKAANLTNVSQMLKARRKVSVSQYEAAFVHQVDANFNENITLNATSKQPFSLLGVVDGKRQYRKN